MNYQGKFISIAGTEYTVTLYDTTGDMTATPESITLGAEPFVVEDDVSDDAMQPVRTQSAKLKIMHNYAELISVSNNLQWRVIVKAGSKIVWAGWIDAEAHDQSWDSMQDEIDYTLSDDLKALQYVNLSQTRSSETIASYLWDGINKMASSTLGTDTLNVFIGNSLPMLDDSVCGMMACSDTCKWIEEDEDDDLNVTYTTKTAYDVLEQFMLVTGCTATSDGANWYIGSVDDTKYRTVRRADFCDDETLEQAFESGTTEGSIGSFTFESMTLRGEQTINICQSAKRVELTAGGAAFDNVIPSLEPDNMKLNWFGDICAFNTSNDAIKWKAGHYISDGNKGVHLYRYDVTDTGGYYTRGQIGAKQSEAVAINETDATKPNVLGVWGGACFLHQDYWETDEDDEGSGSDKGKFNYDFNDRLYLLQCKVPVTFTNKNYPKVGTWSDGPYDSEADAKDGLDNLMSSITSSKMVELFNRNGVGVDSGGLCLTFNAYIQGTIWCGANGKKQVGPIKLNGSSHNTYYLHCSLTIGDYGFNGTTWVKGTSGFFAPLGDGTDMTVNENTKTLAQLYTCTGYSIPITRYISGRCVLRIYGVVSGSVSGEYDEQEGKTVWTCQAVCPDVVMLEDPKVEFCSSLDVDFEEKNEEKRYRKTIDGGGDEVSIECELCTAGNIAENDGMLFYDGAKISSVTCQATSETGEMEKITFNRAVRLNNHARTAIDICVEPSASATPLNKMTAYGTTYYYNGIKEWNLRDDTCKYNYTTK